MWAAMRLTRNPTVEVRFIYPIKSSKKESISLPDGCVGIIYVFKTKKAGREFYKDRKLAFRKIMIDDEE